MKKVLFVFLFCSNFVGFSQNPFTNNDSLKTHINTFYRFVTPTTWESQRCILPLDYYFTPPESIFHSTNIAQMYTHISAQVIHKNVKDLRHLIKKTKKSWGYINKENVVLPTHFKPSHTSMKITNTNSRIFHTRYLFKPNGNYTSCYDLITYSKKARLGFVYRIEYSHIDSTFAIENNFNLDSIAKYYFSRFQLK